MPTLFEYLNATHNSTLELIDASTGIIERYIDLVKELPDFNSSHKKLVFLYLDNSLESVKILLALLKSNHATCLLGTSLNITLKQKLEEIYKPSYIFDYNRSDITSGFPLIYDEGQLKGYKLNDGEYAIHPDIKILLSTSGTTGSPKFVKITDFNLISNTTSILDYLPISALDTCALNLPVNYSYGLSVLLTNIARGGRIVCTNESVLSQDFWALFEKYKCTSISGVPYTYEMLYRIGFTKNKYDSIRYMTQAGGKLSETLIKAFVEYAIPKNIQFYIMYGQTEATARMSYLPPDVLMQKIGSIGKPIKGGKFMLEPGSNELIYAGPNVGCGYAYGMEDLKECTCQENLHTGDIAKVDEEGYYYITGRMKRFVKLFGNRINLDELESDLKEYCGHFMGCTGMEDKKLLVFSDNESLNPESVRNYISTKYQIHISVIKYVFTKSIPLTSNQKVNYQEIISSNGY